MGWYYPALLQMWLKFIFFIVRRTVWSEIESTISNAAKSSANSFNVHCARPKGGFPHDTVMSRASFSPSKTGRSGGSSLFLRSSAVSRPCSTNRCRTFLTVFVEHRYAYDACWSVQSLPYASIANKILACLILYAWVLPFLIKDCN
jgi:hypothetical protein